MTCTPLIVITADRPFELQDCGANQTVDQTKFFGDFVTHFINLPPSIKNENYLKSTLDYASQKKGPIQINIMQQEPFLKHEPVNRSSLAPTQFVFGKSHLDSQATQELAELLNEQENGIITLGNGFSQDECNSIFALSEKLNWPMIVDITSSARSRQHEYIIPYASLMFKQSHKELNPKIVLHFGDRMVCKDMLQWQENLDDQTTIVQVSEYQGNSDPSHRVTHRIHLSPESFCTTLSPHIEQKKSENMLDLFKDKSRQISTTLHRLENDAPLNETFFFSKLSRKLGENEALFIGNSLVIRAADHALYPKQAIGPIFTNRGCSGIDGNIATMAGICMGLDTSYRDYWRSNFFTRPQLAATYKETAYSARYY